MLKLLKQLRTTYNRFDNYYASEAHVRHYDSLIRASSSAQDNMFFTHSKARALIALGREDEAVEILLPQVQKIANENILAEWRKNELYTKSFGRDMHFAHSRFRHS
jgi:hypothetical protein